MNRNYGSHGTFSGWHVQAMEAMGTFQGTHAAMEAMRPFQGGMGSEGPFTFVYILHSNVGHCTVDPFCC